MTFSFAMNGRVADCVQLNYRTPAESVRALLPEGLELVTRGPWAFWNVMCCRVEKLRPSGVPKVCGLTYTHVAYRLQVQAMNERAEVVRGLYFTRSDADARVAALLGNRLTDLRLHPAAITLDAGDCGVRCVVSGTDDALGNLELDAAHAPARLASDSCFPSIEDARRFCRYTPNGLAVTNAGGKRLLRITRVSRPEHAWSETPLAIHSAKLGYFDAIGQTEHVQLEWACRLSPMDYRWDVGQTVPLLTQPTKVERPSLVAG